MKIVAINDLPTGSPATIMRGILSVAQNELGATTYSFYGNWKKSPSKYLGSERFGFKLENYISGCLSRFLGLHNIGSVVGTHNLVKRLNRIKPDIIHLHNIHLWDINIPILFRYIKKHHIPVVWTLHDCWPFTGRCPYFQVSSCNKWKTGCADCSYPWSSYPASFIDTTRFFWKMKRRWFGNVEKMVLTTPSIWLSKLIKDSFLKHYDVSVINNGINLQVFKPTKSGFRAKYGIANDRIMLLGVSLNWNYYKGIDVFFDLYRLLDKRYVIVLVGDIDDQSIPEGIVHIARTNNAEELAAIYSAADVFVNPTREENYPTVNMESIACGTPVITFDTGGCRETILEHTGIVTKEKNALSIVRALKDFEKNGIPSCEDCVSKSSSFDANNKFNEYVELYMKQGR